MTSSDQRLSISFFANLLIVTEIAWSIFSFLILNKHKQILHSETWFECFKFSILCSSILFWRSKCWLCYPNSSTSLFKKMNLFNVTISITWWILLSFLLNLTDLSLKVSHILILQSCYLVHRFYIAISTIPRSCRLFFLLSFYFYWVISLFCDVILLSI